VEAKVAAEQQVDHYEQIFVVVEREPQINEERMLKLFEQFDLTKDIAQRVGARTYLLVHILHRVHSSAVFLLRYTYLHGAPSVPQCRKARFPLPELTARVSAT